MKFIEYAEQLSMTIGEHHLPLKPQWRKACDMVHADAIHHRMAQQIFSRIYKQNGCTRPTDPVLMGLVMDALGELGQEFMETGETDAERYQLLTDIGEVSLELLGEGNQNQRLNEDKIHPLPLK
ncbi:MAG: hypothetical protein ACI8P9_001176 [Parasphingorhabdus sp.]